MGLKRGAIASSVAHDSHNIILVGTNDGDMKVALERIVEMGGGLVAALEILINTPATANLIRQGKLEQLETAMQSGRKTGQCTMDKAIAELFDRGTISGRAAYDFANDKEKFKEHRLLDA